MIMRSSRVAVGASTEGGIARRLRRVRIRLRFALLRLWIGAHNRKAWLFAGSESAGKRAAVVMSLVQSARLHGHDPWVYLRDVLERLLSHTNHRIDELLPHRWQPLESNSTANT